MKKFVLKELFYFFGILIILTFLVHPDLLSNPTARFEQILITKDYTHPLIFSAILYFIVLIVRAIIKIFKK